MSLSRRTFVAAGMGALIARPVEAMGRKPIGGRLRLRWPYATDAIDPHDLFDPLAACLGTAIFNTVYARDSRGRVYSALAAGLPRQESGETTIRLRGGLRSASGRRIDARDLLTSFKRAKGRTAGVFLAMLPSLRMRIDPSDALRLRCGRVDPATLAELLCSPLFPLLPGTYDPRRPDGTGGFKATLLADRVTLDRNGFAARGSSFLDGATIRSASDLTSSMRAFEMERDDLGWLGLGLHRDRAKARPFDFGDVGWMVLTTGDRARPLAPPGVAQQLANAVNVEALHLGLRPREGLQRGMPWLGEPTSLYYEKGSAHLRVVAERVAAQLSSRGHEIRAASIGSARWRRLRQNRDYSLAVQFVRDPRLGPWAVRAALAAVDRRRLAEEIVSRKTRRAPARPAHLLTANLRVGVLGALSVRGGIAAGWHMPAQVHGGGIDWSNIHRL
ncbi:MAG: hypothetical protein VB934_03130 [Polyangiaceae bacterium]